MSEGKNQIDGHTSFTEDQLKAAKDFLGKLSDKLQDEGRDVLWRMFWAGRKNGLQEGYKNAEGPRKGAVGDMEEVTKEKLAHTLKQANFDGASEYNGNPASLIKEKAKQMEARKFLIKVAKAAEENNEPAGLGVEFLKERLRVALGNSEQADKYDRPEIIAAQKEYADLVAEMVAKFEETEHNRSYFNIPQKLAEHRCTQTTSPTTSNALELAEWLTEIPSWELQPYMVKINAQIFSKKLFDLVKKLNTGTDVPDSLSERLHVLARRLDLDPYQ